MSTTCHQHRAHSLLAEDAPYWTGPAGITSRLAGVAQHFTYITVNNAMRTLGEKGQVEYLEWVVMGDDRVCPKCRANAAKGEKGRFKPGWFMPIMPAHYGCRCQWRAWYEAEN